MAKKKKKPRIKKLSYTTIDTNIDSIKYRLKLLEMDDLSSKVFSNEEEYEYFAVEKLLTFADIPTYAKFVYQTKDKKNKKAYEDDSIRSRVSKNILFYNTAADMESFEKKNKSKKRFFVQTKQGNKLASMIESAKNEINAIESSYSRATLANKRVEEILNTLNALEPTEEFDDEIFKRLVESVTINDRCKITFKFKVGLERTIETTIK